MGLFSRLFGSKESDQQIAENEQDDSEEEALDPAAAVLHDVGEMSRQVVTRALGQAPDDWDSAILLLKGEEEDIECSLFNGDDESLCVPVDEVVQRFAVGLHMATSQTGHSWKEARVEMSKGDDGDWSIGIKYKYD